MPRIDGYPAAAALTGTDVLPVMQGGETKSTTADAVTAYVQAQLEPWIRELIAAGGGGTVGSPLTFSDGSAAMFSDGTPILFSS